MIWDFQRILSIRLMVWAAASLLASGLSILAGGLFWQGFGLQMFVWGLLAALIAGLGRRGLAKKLTSSIDLAEMANRARFLRRVLTINAGLDMLYLAGGAALVLFSGPAAPYNLGMGWGILVQALFLELFDSLHAWRVPQEILLADLHLFYTSEHAPFLVENGIPAALIVHGFPDTPNAIRPLSDMLEARGWSVSGLLLPGFGCELPTLYQRRTDEWITAIQSEVERLKQTHHPVILVGFSMGAGCSIPAAVRSHPDGLVLLAPFWWNETLPLKLLYYTLRLLGPYSIHIGQWVNFKNMESLSAGIGEIAPGVFMDDPGICQAIRDLRVPLAFMEQFRVLGRTIRSSAPDWHGPTLILQGSSDSVVHPGSTRRLIKLLGCGPIYYEIPGGHNLNRKDHLSYLQVIHQLTAFADSIYTR